MKTSDILKYTHEIGAEVAIKTASSMRGLLHGAKDIHAFESTLDVPTYLAAWEHLSSQERSAWKAMSYLGKVNADL